MADKGKRMSALRPLRIAAAQILACILVVVARVVYLYGLNFWQSTTAINFLAAWIPAAIGIVVGAELRNRYRFKRRTPYDFYSNAGEQQASEFGVGI